MRTLWAILLGGLALVGTAEARLGESKEQVIERYGKPYREDVEAPWDNIIYCSKDGYKFCFMLLHGKVEFMIVMKEDGLTEADVKIFLDKNSSGSGFVDDVNRGDGFYVEADSGRMGIWGKDALVLVTEEGHKARTGQVKENLKKKTDGF